MSDNAAVPILYDSVQRMVCPFCRERMDVGGLAAFTKAVCPSCQHEVPVPARLGAFLLLDLLGTGGMGCVYRAHDETLGRDVAIKVMLKSLGDSPEFVKTFRHEAQAAAKLNHPHIAQIYSFGQEKGQPYIVMELVPGKHFDLMIAGPEPLDPALVMKIGADIAEGLQVASEAGLVHGDIKPENILLDEKNQAKLVDFGIAGNVNQSQGEIWGTPYYIAPEKVRRQRIDHRSDIYCLGGTLYHALTGHPPFEGADAVEVVKARFKGPPLALDQARPGIDPELVPIVSRMLQVEPAMRYPTYESLLGDIRRYLSHATPAPAVGAGKRIVLNKGKNRTGKNVTGKMVTGKMVTGDASGASGTTASLSSTARHKNLMVTRGLTAESNIAGAGGGDAAGNGAKAKAGGVKKVGKGGKGCLVAALVGLGILLLIGLLTGAYFLHLKQQVEKSATEATVARAKLAAQMDRWSTQTLTLKVTLEGYAHQADAAVAEAVKLAVQELGEDVRPQLELPAEAAAPAPVPAAGDTNAPAAAPAAEGAGDEAAAPADESALPERVRQAREVARHAVPLRQVAKRAQQTCDIMAEYMTKVMTTTNSLEQARVYVDRAERLYGDLEGYAKRAPDRLRAVQEKLDAMRRAAEAGAAARAREEARLKSEAAEREKEAERLRREAEQREAVAGEIAKVQSVESAQLDVLRKHLYTDALRALRDLDEGIRTEEGQNALRVAKERVQGLLELKDYLVKRLNEGKFRAPAGWSVVSATPRSVSVRSVTGKVEDVPWDRMGVAQIVPFIQFYLLDEQQVRALKLRERIGQSINAAVYCITFGEGREAAHDMAVKLVQQCVDLYPDARIDVDRVLPDLLPRE